MKRRRNRNNVFGNTTSVTDKNTVQPIRVCFVILGAYPLFNPEIKKNFGGAEVDSYYLGTELAKDKQFEVSFIVGNYGQPEIEVREGVRIIKSADTTKSKIFWIRPLWRAMKQANADIYFRKMSSLVTGLTVLFCKVKNKIFVYRTAHERECNGIYIKNHFLRGRAFVWALQQAKFVFAQNHRDAENLKSIAHISSTVIRNAHRLPKREPIKRDTILWVGRNIDFKKPERFLELAKQFPTHNFLMICQKASQNKIYNKLVEEAQKISNLTFLPRVPFHEIGKYYQQAKIFVCTSDAEGFPNTYIQACISGSPILSFKVNPDNFIIRYQCGLCANGNWTTFLEQLQQLLDTELAAQYGMNAREYVENNHDISKIIMIYKNAFRHLTKNN
jgi:glycosyltransferase involved in cell wall biosynthesis